MLGKQWLTRYLRHVGGSIPERCGDRQRKLGGLEEWYFRLVIEGLSILLQITLLLLSWGLSRYTWSLNTSVAGLVVALTALPVVFYLVIVVASSFSYRCPFQTPASLVLRAIRRNRSVRKLFTRVFSLAPPVSAQAGVAKFSLTTPHRLAGLLRKRNIENFPFWHPFRNTSRRDKPGAWCCTIPPALGSGFSKYESVSGWRGPWLETRPTPCVY